MNNIVIYSSNPMPGLETLLAEIDDAEVRTVDINQMKDYAVINPSLMIVENIDAAQDALMTNKFPCPILFFGEARRDFTVRSEGHDFIVDPFKKDELLVRVNALLRIKAIKDKLERVSTTDDLTGLHNRKYLQERLEEENKQESDYRFMLDARQYLLDKTNIQLPEEFMKRWLYMANEGKFTMEEIEKDFPLFLKDFRWQSIAQRIMKLVKRWCNKLAVWLLTNSLCMV